ncbi:CASP8 and FADD-like apoptosis regulator [Micropterus salmoides]|uniref:CASP8 and FADD-like apoptosis regulator n=1 Tax=Micropterus salmoides TaxID=27706 RepID=UPI0018EC9E14|nr:CASP8 and FADD-like apoptosis regulator [Micropterus salmoides]XP_038576275.1 CASP8 and FADD-like apoptosis regulator [Micropterus salmoides]
MALPDHCQLQVINEISEALCSGERRILLYLCEILDTDNSVGCLKATLESKAMCYERWDLFLAELILALRRYDILKKVWKTSREQFERTLKVGPVLPKFRVLMVNIGEEMANDDLDSLKFLLSKILLREKMEKAQNFLDVIIELEKLDKVSPERVDILEKKLRDIGRVDLAKKVTAYKMSELFTVTSELHISQQRCRAPHLLSPSNSSHPLLQTRRGQSFHSENIPAPVYREQTYQSPLDCYKFNSNPRGVCLIIDCVGNDGVMLEDTFKALQFNVVVHNWLSGGDIYSTLAKISTQRENLEGDGFVCCIMSRGTSDYLLGTDSNSTGLRLDNVRRLFTADACPMLAGKPKLFFIQRYSIPESQPYATTYHQDEDLETDGYDGLARCDIIPTDADVFWSHCWTDARQLEQGLHCSIYLKALTDALCKGQRRKTHLVDIHTEVNGALFEHNKRNPGASYHIDLKHTLRKDVYLQ